MAVVTSGSRCPCLSGETYGSCCLPLHRGTPAPTATRLMRSRYSAFAVGDAQYLLATWDPATRPKTLELDSDARWYRLDIVGASGGGPFDSVGTVDFVAYYRADGESHTHGEHSRFRRTEGAWLYVDGVTS